MMGAMGFISTLGARQAAYELDVLRGRYRTTEGGQVVDKKLAEVVTVTRNTAGGHFNEQGLFEMVPADTPRIDYDPITKAIRGLLIESASTNLFPRSMDMSLCTPIRCTLKANAGVAPDGTLTAARMTATGEYDPIISRGATISGGIAGKTVTFSVFINCDNTTQKIGLYIYGWTNTEQVAFKQFDAVAGWRRYQITQTFTSAAVSTGVSVRVDMADGLSPVAGSSMLLWGGQVELQAWASSHIPTPALFSSRAGAAVYLDEGGTLRTAAVNEGRTKAYAVDSSGMVRPIGLLVEPQATNYFLGSAAISAMTTLQNATVAADTTIAPDGTKTADTVTMTGVASSGVYRSNAVTVADLCVWSVYLKPLTGDGIVRVGLDGGGFTTNGPQYVVFDLLNGSIVSATQYATPTLERLPNGWWRCGCSAPISNTSNPQQSVVIYGQNTTTKSFAAWGGQLEKGSVPTSYIATAGATVTRAADVFTEPTVTRALDAVAGKNAAAWLDTDKGTVLVEFTTFGTAGWPGVYSLAPDFFMYADAANKRTGVSGRGSAGQLFKPVTQLQDVVIRRVDSYDLQGMASAQGGTATASNTLAQTAKATGLGIGVGGAYRLDGHIRLLRYYPLRVTDIERETLSS